MYNPLRKNVVETQVTLLDDGWEMWLLGGELKGIMIVKLQVKFTHETKKDVQYAWVSAENKGEWSLTPSAQELIGLREDRIPAKCAITPEEMIEDITLKLSVHAGML